MEWWGGFLQALQEASLDCLEKSTVVGDRIHVAASNIPGHGIRSVAVDGRVEKLSKIKSASDHAGIIGDDDSGHNSGDDSDDESGEDADAAMSSGEEGEIEVIGEVSGGGVRDGVVEAHVTTVSGTLRQVNSLLYVEAFRSKYRPECGDIIVGRVCALGQERWLLDIGAANLATLQLATISLPSGEQRKKTDAEATDLRRFFKERDLVVTEVQKTLPDGGCVLHTRNARYGKLDNGLLVVVSHQNVAKLANSMVHLSCAQIHVTLARNGFIFLSPPAHAQVIDTLNYSATTSTPSQRPAFSHKPFPPSQRGTDSSLRGADSLREAGSGQGEGGSVDASRFKGATAQTHKDIARVAACIRLLNRFNLLISPATIELLYTHTLAQDVYTLNTTHPHTALPILHHLLT